MYSLEVRTGYDKAHVIRIERDVLRIGRGEDNDLLLIDETVSRTHAVIEKDGDSYCIRDLGSHNGIVINEKRISRHKLIDGDLICIGGNELVFYLLTSVAADSVVKEKKNLHQSTVDIDISPLAEDDSLD